MYIDMYTSSMKDQGREKRKEGGSGERERGKVGGRDGALKPACDDLTS